MRGRATLRTAPMPVTAPQPSSAACQSGTSTVERHDARGRDDGALGEAGDREAVLQRRPVRQRQPRRAVHQRARARPASPAGPQSVGRPARQALQVPQDGIMQSTTRSPGATCATPSPTASTVPAPSCPSTIGQRPSPRRPSARCRSEWQTPQAAMRTSTSPAFGGAQLDVLDADVARLAQDDRPHATRQRSSASRSGVTPSPGPGGGAIVPSAAISTSAGSSQSRRSADQAGGSYGTSTYGHVETPSVEVQVADEAVAVRPRVRAEHAPAEVGQRGQAAAAGDAAREHDVGLQHVDAAAQDEVARLVRAAHHLARGDAHAASGRRSAR